MRTPASAAGAENARREKIRRSSALPFSAVGAGVVVFALALPTRARAQQAEATPVYETVITPRRDPALPREDLTASASVITADRTPRSGETLPKLLSELPGVNVTRYGSYGSLSMLSVRGSSPNQVAVYVDGVPLAGALTGTVDLGLVPASVAQRIEVYRGQSPLPFGSSAMGGIVSITSEAPERSGLQLESGAGSFATRHGGGTAALVGRAGSLVGRLNLFRSQADFPYRSDNGTLLNPADDQALHRRNNDLDQLDAAVRGAMTLAGGRQLMLSLSGLQREQGLPARGIHQSFRSRLFRRRLAASASYESPVDLGPGSRVKTTLYGLGSEQRLTDPLGEISFVDTRTRDRSLTVGATAVASRPLGESLVLAAMLDARHEAFFPHDLIHQAQRLPGRRDFGAAAVSATHWITRWNLELLASVRAEAAHDQVSPDNDLAGRPAAATQPANYLLPIARAGLSHSPHPRLRLRANAGRYARLPTLFERYGNAGNIVGNAALVPERGLNADVGASWQLGDLAVVSPQGPDAKIDGKTAAPLAASLDVSVFVAESRDLIHFEQKGYYAGYTNVARARSQGAELSLDARAFEVLRLFLKATAIDARDHSGDTAHDGRRLPQLPALRGYARPELRDLPLGQRFALGVYGELEATGSRYQDQANQIPQAGRLLLGAGASLAYRPAGVRLVASAYNLTGVMAPDILDFPTPGRSFFLTLQFAYEPRDPDRVPPAPLSVLTKQETSP